MSVTNPKHYITDSECPTILLFDVGNFPFYLGCIIKYLIRYKKSSNPVNDLKKAKFYLQRAVEKDLCFIEVKRAEMSLSVLDNIYKDQIRDPNVWCIRFILTGDLDTAMYLLNRIICDQIIKED